MELIVDISERDYNTIVTALDPRIYATLMQEAIANGVPVPRGYKRPTENNIEVEPVFDKEGLLIGYKHIIKEDLDSTEIIFPALCPLIHSIRK